MIGFTNDIWQRRFEYLKILYNLEEIKGKFIHQKTIFSLEYFGIKSLNFNFKRHKYGPYSFELENEIDFLEEKGFITLVNDYNENRIIVNRKRIEKVFDKYGLSLKLSSEEGKAIYKIEDLFLNDLKDLEMIELIASILLIINERKYVLKSQIINELQKWKPSIFDKEDIEKAWDLLSLKKILPEIVRDVNDLPKIKPGMRGALKYRKLVSKIVSYIFKESFRNMKEEYRTHKRRKYIDTVYTNSAQEGFFKDLPEKNRNIICNYIIMEAKNYTYDPANPEFDQLAGRLNKKVGNFGILVCRTVNNEKLALERCQSYLDDDKFVIILSDKNIIELVGYARLGLFAEINDFIDNKFSSIIFRS